MTLTRDVPGANVFGIVPRLARSRIGKCTRPTVSRSDSLLMWSIKELLSTGTGLWRSDVVLGGGRWPGATSLHSLQGDMNKRHQMMNLHVHLTTNVSMRLQHSSLAKVKISLNHDSFCAWVGGVRLDFATERHQREHDMNPPCISNTASVFYPTVYWKYHASRRPRLQVYSSCLRVASTERVNAVCAYRRLDQKGARQ